MVKKMIISVIISLLQFTFLPCCKNDSYDIPQDSRPVFQSGNFILYINGSITDTFKVTHLQYDYIYDLGDHANLQVLNYDLEKTSLAQNDSSDFIKLHFFDGIKDAATLYLTSARGETVNLLRFDRDSLYQNYTINGKNYHVVSYYSLNKLNSVYRNLYFNFQFGLLSLEVKGQPTYLSAIK